MAETTAGNVLDDFAPLLYFIQVAAGAAACQNLFQLVLEQFCTHPARHAPSTGLFLKKTGEIVNGFQDVPFGSDYDHRPACTQIIITDFPVEFLFSDESAAGTANLDRPGVLGAHHRKDHPHRQAGGQLVDTGTLAVAGYADQLCACGLPAAERDKPLRAFLHHTGGCGQSFNIVDQGRFAEVAGLNRKRRPVPGLAALALGRIDQS